MFSVGEHKLNWVPYSLITFCVIPLLCWKISLSDDYIRNERLIYKPWFPVCWDSIFIVFYCLSRRVICVVANFHIYVFTQISRKEQKRNKWLNIWVYTKIWIFATKQEVRSLKVQLWYFVYIGQIWTFFDTKEDSRIWHTGQLMKTRNIHNRNYEFLHVENKSQTLNSLETIEINILLNDRRDLNNYESKR